MLCNTQKALNVVLITHLLAFACLRSGPVNACSCGGLARNCDERCRIPHWRSDQAGTQVLAAPLSFSYHKVPQTVFVACCIMLFACLSILCRGELELRTAQLKLALVTTRRVISTIPARSAACESEHSSEYIITDCLPMFCRCAK